MAQTVPVWFNVNHFTGVPYGRTITLSPAPDSLLQSDGTNLITGGPITLPNTPGGVVTNLWPGHYVLTINGISKSWTLTVTNGATTLPLIAAQLCTSLPVPQLTTIAQSLTWLTNEVLFGGGSGGVATNAIGNTRGSGTNTTLYGTTTIGPAQLLSGDPNDFTLSDGADDYLILSRTNGWTFDAGGYNAFNFFGGVVNFYDVVNFLGPSGLSYTNPGTGHSMKLDSGANLSAASFTGDVSGATNANASTLFHTGTIPIQYLPALTATVTNVLSISTNFFSSDSQRVADRGIEYYGINRFQWPRTTATIETNGQFTLWFFGNGWIWDGDFSVVVSNLCIWRPLAGFGSIFRMNEPGVINYGPFSGQDTVSWQVGADQNWLGYYAIMNAPNQISSPYAQITGLPSPLCPGSTPGILSYPAPATFDGLRVAYGCSPTGGTFNVEIRTNGASFSPYLDLGSEWIVVGSLNAAASSWQSKVFQWTNSLGPCPTQMRVRSTSSGTTFLLDMGQWNSTVTNGIILGMFAHDSGPILNLYTNQTAVTWPVWAADNPTCVIYTDTVGDTNDNSFIPALLQMMQAGFPHSDIIDIGSHGAASNLGSFIESAMCLSSGIPFFRGELATSDTWGSFQNSMNIGMVDSNAVPHLTELGYQSFGELVWSWLGWFDNYIPTTLIQANTLPIAASGGITLTTNAGTLVIGSSAGGGNVVSGGQNNFSGSNYFAGLTTFNLPPVGAGSGLSNLNGSAIQLGTVNSNKLDAATMAWLEAFAGQAIGYPQVTNLASAPFFDPAGAAASVKAGTPLSLGSAYSTNFAPLISSPWWRGNGAFLTVVRSSTNGNKTMNECGANTAYNVAYSRFIFTPPHGATATTFSYSAAPMTPYVQTHYIGFGVSFYNDTENLSFYTVTSPSSGWTNISLTTNLLTNLTAFIELNYSNTLSISNLSITFSGSLTNAALTNAFRRYDVLPRNIKNTGWFELTNMVAAEESEVSFVTGASYLTLELFQYGNTLSNLVNGAGGGYPISIYTNGIFYGNYAPPSPPNNDYATAYYDVYLPTNVTTLVTVVNSSGLQVPETYPAEGTWLRSIFIPQNQNVTFSLDQARRKMWVLGDSITSDNEVLYYNSNVVSIENNIFHLVNRLTDIDTVLNAESYAMLWNLYGLRKQECIASAVNVNPSDIWIEVGRNDWAYAGTGSPFATYSGTNAFAADYADLLDRLHFALPQARIYTQTPIPQYFENNGYGSGYTLSQYRQAIQGVAATRTNFVTFVDGTTLITTNKLIDGIHPTDVGNSIYALNMYPYLMTFPPMANTGTYNGSGAGLSGFSGAVLPITASGSITLTTNAGTLVIGSSAGGGNVVSGGQNNFSGSNYFGAQTTLNGGLWWSTNTGAASYDASMPFQFLSGASAFTINGFANVTGSNAMCSVLTLTNTSLTDWLFTVPPNVMTPDGARFWGVTNSSKAQGRGVFTVLIYANQFTNGVFRWVY